MFHPWDETESNRSWSKAWINGFLDTGNVDYNQGQPPWSRWSSTWMASHPAVIHAWTLACQLCRSAPSMVTAHSTECDLPSSECVSYMDLAGHSLLPILFSQLWFRQSQRSQWNSFMESESKGASNVQKDSLQWTSDTDCAETTDIENSVSWATKRFWILCFLPWTCLSQTSSQTLCYQLRWQQRKVPTVTLHKKVWMPIRRPETD